MAVWALLTGALSGSAGWPVSYEDETLETGWNDIDVEGWSVKSLDEINDS